jgi:hypothetical protein
MQSTSPFRNRRKSRGIKIKIAQGVVSKCSTRIAKSGSHAHSFYIKEEKYSIFTNDELSPVTEGDRVRFEYELRELKSKWHAKYNAVIPESLIIEAPVELNSQIEGFVYILSNPSMPGILKVGFTTGTVIKRAEELSRVTSIPKEFKVEWTLPVLGNPRMVEQTAHAHLAKYKHGKEFFEVSLDIAKTACIDSFVKLYPEKASLRGDAFAVRAELELKRRNELKKIFEQHEEDKEKGRKELEERINHERKRVEENMLARRKEVEERWLIKGSCRLILNKFEIEPTQKKPSFISKLLGYRSIDFLDCSISPSQENNNIVWYVTISGRHNMREIKEFKRFQTKDESLNYAHDMVRFTNIYNFRNMITIPNHLIESPPELPADNYNPQTILTIESIEHLILRPIISM